MIRKGSLADGPQQHSQHSVAWQSNTRREQQSTENDHKDHKAATDKEQHTARLRA
jgi:hypothetical protein